MAAVVLASAAALAQDSARPGKSERKDLLVGDKAPPLTIEKWVKGEAIGGYEKGKVYVVEFWATWCGPCIQVQPHMTELQKKFRDQGVTMIGVTSPDDRGNTLEAVESLVKKRDDKMGYTVAWDKGRTTNEAYMEAAGQMGIPCAFLVDQEGTLAWVGHPAELDDPLEQVVAKKWDLKKAAEKFKVEFEENKEEMRFQEAMEESREAVEKLQAAMEKNDIPAALKILDELSAAKPITASRLSMARFHILLDNERYEEAYAAAQAAADKYFAGKAMPLVQFARMILMVEPAEKRNADLAVKFASRAAELQPDEGFILDTLAMGYAEKRDYARAVETLRKAVTQAEKQRAPEEALSDMKDRLKQYESKAKGADK